MITIIAGSRDGAALKDVENAVSMCGWQVTAVVSGTARGVDQMGESVAKKLGLPIHRYPADWDAHGKSAGYKRNVKMAENAEALIAVWDGKSRGTSHMIDIAKSKGLIVYVHRV